MREWIEFYYRNAIETATIIEEGSNRLFNKTLKEI